MQLKHVSTLCVLKTHTGRSERPCAYLKRTHLQPAKARATTTEIIGARRTNNIALQAFEEHSLPPLARNQLCIHTCSCIWSVCVRALPCLSAHPHALVEADVKVHPATEQGQPAKVSPTGGVLVDWNFADGPSPSSSNNQQPMSDNR